MNQDDLFEEQKRVDTVITYIDECLRKLDEQLSDREKDVIYIKKNFWEDVTVNLDNDEEKAETFSSIKQQADLLSERERSQKHDANQYKKLERLKDSPYFGRIDFIEEGKRRRNKFI
ncbi:hypothetical protein [Bacillus sp. JCM 19034]|uniref:hypothetical protein n=1 Tax=Bacillus sp. JCM 19034 TaxID=1481928 RepID=UPI0007837A58|nr:hypothetical protein [Bacillus sp. JCM 19034]